MIEGLPEYQKKYFLELSQKDDKRLKKELEKLQNLNREKIKQKRKIREKYTEFKIENPEEPKPDYHLKKSTNFITARLEEVLNDRQQCKL